MIINLSELLMVENDLDHDDGSTHTSFKVEVVFLFKTSFVTPDFHISMEIGMII